MSSWPSTLLILLIGIAGWYYLFYSKAAHRLGAVETTTANLRRIRLRRINGAAMILLASLLYIGTRAIDPQERPRTFLAVWVGIAILLLVTVILAMLDMRLTMKLRNRDQVNGNLP